MPKTKSEKKTASSLFTKLGLISRSKSDEGFLSTRPAQVKKTTSLARMTGSNVEQTPRLKGYSKLQELKLVKIGLASSQQIIEWAEKILPNGKIFGEVLNPNTLHYKTFKPHKGGLFCERIFGPLKDFQCACGLKQKPFDDEDSIQNLLTTKPQKRVFCDMCDVEYTWSVIRRYQLGYIRLASPVSHLWYLKNNPSYLSLLLDLRKRDVESIVYCMQITTLEYYWKPSHVFQSNLDATAFFKSYKTFLNFEQQNKTSRFSDKRTMALSKKQNAKLAKRRELVILRRSSRVTSTTFEKIEHLKKEPLQKQIQYLEQSFRLSTSEGSSARSAKAFEVTRFLHQQISRKIKKKTFWEIQKNSQKEFFQRLHKLVTNRYRKSLGEVLISSVRSNLDKNIEHLLIGETRFMSERKAIDECSTFKRKTTSSIGRLLKSRLKKEDSGTKMGVDLRTSLARLTNRNTTSEQRREGSKMLHFSKIDRRPRFPREALHSRKPFDNDTSLLSSFVVFLNLGYFKKSWSTTEALGVRSLPVFCFFEKISVSSKASAVERIVHECFFLYLLVVIQKNADSFLKAKPLAFKMEQVFRAMYHHRNGVPQTRTAEFEFLSKFLQTNYLANRAKRPIVFFEIQKLYAGARGKPDVFDRLANLLVRRSIFVLIRRLKSQGSTPIAVEKNGFVGSVREFKSSFFDCNENVFAHDFLAEVSKVFATGKTEVLSIVEPSEANEKLHGFLNNQERYPETVSDYSKNRLQKKDDLIALKRDLSSKERVPLNNLYCVAYSKGWTTDKDWKYFLYYNTSPIELADRRPVYYDHRFGSVETSNLPVIGGHFVEKILNQYQGRELKAMARQTQMVLPKLNRYIRMRKRLARRKTQVVEIQRFLQKRDEMVRRLKLLRKFFKKNSTPTSMILNALPVLPPDLRPILKMQNQIAASDLNRFYQRILYRNDRLKKFLRSTTAFGTNEPGFEIKYAQRLLQEAVDNLIQNGKGNVKPETNSRGQPLKSLSEILKGKQGRFRQYLLGKRVDYSGRSVIVVGPTLKIQECGLPFEMALELFLPFLIKKIFQYKLAKTIVGAKTILKNQPKTTWNLLEEIMKNHPVLLNRAPTLHRLGIQAFQPKLIEGRAILLHPLVCPAFNADFDGDQMAVHVPITVEARTEAWKLMFSRNHMISPATGEPMLLPSQDMVLGCYYLTTEYFQKPRFNRHRPFNSSTGFYFSNVDEALNAYFRQKIHLQTPIWIKWNGLSQSEEASSEPLEIRLSNDGFWTELRSRSQKRLDNEGNLRSFFVRTTAGRVLLNGFIQTCIRNA